MLFIQQVRWIDRLCAWHDSDSSWFVDALEVRPTLPVVVAQPYMNAGWGAARRLAAIEAHYQLIDGPLRMFRVAQRSRMRLATIEQPGKSGRIDVVLDSPLWLAHEGELALHLYLCSERLYSLAFSFGEEHGLDADTDQPHRTAYIGACQGMGKEHALETYRELTRDLHGQRPRDLLVLAFRMLCEETAVDRILAVGDTHQACRGDYYSESAKVFASYDALWTEYGGVLRTDGFFELPVRIERRSAESIPPRKRCQYRRRYEMLDQLRHDMQRALRDGGQP